jgi:putative ABC transport system permease protein
MGFIIALAFKNLFRYRRRTIITAIAIAAGVSMYIFIDGWLLGAQNDSVRNLVKFETGSARVMDKKYWEEHDYLLPKYNIAKPAAAEAALEKAGYAVAPRVTVFAEAVKTGGAGESFTLQLAGIDPARDRKIFDFANALTPKGAAYLAAGRPEIMLGSDAAGRLGAGLNDSVRLTTRTKDGVWTTLEVKVVAILSTPDPIVNNAMGFVPLDVLQNALELGDGVTDIVIGFPEWLNPEKETAKINALLAAQPDSGGYDAKSFNELAAEFGMIAQSKSGGSKIILFLIFIIAAIGISNTVLMAVFERVREIGMMRALGMKNGAVMWCFVFEALGIGLFGALAGVVLGVLIDLYMVNIGIDLTPLLKNMGNIGYRILGVSRSSWNPDTIFSSALVSMIFSGAMAIFPARRALKKEITECLRVK